ncbi:16S rRNA (cytidine1402-2'-O)-methyltransferase [Acetoanaerobium pronyense]|uniref:Ribosomal RNA small subunit methyltransferase I n=1 Tax=Acetoanaerobium pronyense TaxID=1482736 RepID=A0ABS4KJU9_9FIRM|nr:16S rRNA (cytidine(1402)-2'-O)-methyltransferase [Acetoanaerobium pronyense]MBP2028062.1 16S rRNA (cytidine1402-2'-O)-methyltransferase [Acetoanaerobium pronyense]
MSKLYICPTPIGNLEDITLRTIRILKEVDVVAAEDTRRTIKLMNHLEIKKPLISLREHNEDGKSESIISMVKEGKTVALVSDAGMPGISDPGEILIRKAIEEEVEVITLPGPSAFIVALVNSGLSTSRFTFIGFLDRTSKNRVKELEDLKNKTETLIIYESPHRIKNTLKDIYKILGNRKIVLARELTKIHEEYIRMDIKDMLENIDSLNILGEMIIILEGAAKKEEDEQIKEEVLIKELYELMEEGLSTKDASKEIAKKYNLGKNQVYSLALKSPRDI